MDDTQHFAEIDKLTAKLQAAQLPPDLMQKAVEQINRINLTVKYGGNFAQLDITSKYIEWVTSLPWNSRTPDILDINAVKAALDKNHYGLDKIKNRIMEYLSMVILQKQRLNTEVFHAPALFFVGLAGTGKTTFAVSLAEALGRKFVRIPFGGLSSALDLRGQSKTAPESEPGMVMRALRRVGSKNPVILLDELDRVAPETRSTIMGVLLELLDPGQNKSFTDYFIDYPFDLSEVIFVATANNTNNIATAVLDRLEQIQMPSYTDEEKLQIGKRFVLPKYLKQVGLTPEMVTVDDKVWAIMVRGVGFEPGIRSLERLIETLVRKVALKMITGQGTQFTITEINMREFVPL